MANPILEVRGLTKRFGAHEVLRGIDLHVMPAEHVALVGNNGQGKTTLIRLILGLLRPAAGEIRLAGEAMERFRSPTQKRMIGYLPESVSFYPHLTGWQTLRFFGQLKHAGAQSGAVDLDAEIERLLERVGLAAAAGRKVREYSKGMRQRLGLSAALLGSPRLLLLDEPTNGLDPEGVHQFYDILASLQRDDVAILMASHLLAEIEARLDRLAILRQGVIETSGTILELTATARLPTLVKFSLLGASPILPPGLARFGAAPVRNGKPHTYALQTEGRAALEVLHELMRHSALIEAVTVREPGLEDLFRQLNPPALGEPESASLPTESP